MRTFAHQFDHDRPLLSVAELYRRACTNARKLAVHTIWSVICSIGEVLLYFIASYEEGKWGMRVGERTSLECLYTPRRRSSTVSLLSLSIFFWSLRLGKLHRP